MVLCLNTILWRRWASQEELREIDMGEAMVLLPGALAAISSFSRLLRLTCRVQDDLPEPLTKLVSLQALQLTWDVNMDAGKHCDSGSFHARLIAHRAYARGPW